MNIEFKNDSDMNICLQREDTDKYIYIKSIEDGIRIEYTDKEDDKPNNQTDYKHKEKVETNKIKPKELLKNGMFILEGDIWYVVVDDNLVGEDGSYDLIKDYDDNLCWRKGNSFSIDVIVEAVSFNSARNNYKVGHILWERK